MIVEPKQLNALRSLLLKLYETADVKSVELKALSSVNCYTERLLTLRLGDKCVDEFLAAFKELYG
jgi:hypothetical protein